MSWLQLTGSTVVWLAVAWLSVGPRPSDSRKEIGLQQRCDCGSLTRYNLSGTFDVCRSICARLQQTMSMGYQACHCSIT